MSVLEFTELLRSERMSGDHLVQSLLKQAQLGQVA